MWFGDPNKKMNYWLLKSEPLTFSIDDLAARPKKTEPWEGVRNYQARNMLRDQIKKGDQAFFYHSSCPVPGIAGIVEIVKSGYPDAAAFDPDSPYYDPNSTHENPRWYRVDVKLLKKFPSIISLQNLKQESSLKNFALLQRGNRLSVMPVKVLEWECILRMANKK